MLSNIVEGVVDYAFLIAMTLTSFKFLPTAIEAKQWKLLSKLKGDCERNLLFLLPGLVAVLLELAGSACGLVWSPQVYDLLFAFKIADRVLFAML